MEVMFDYKEFAVAIIRKKFDIQVETQKKIGLREMAKQIGTTTATLHRATHGGKKADLDTVLLICKWLGTPITEFINQ